jgi:hypothetical protein
MYHNKQGELRWTHPYFEFWHLKVLGILWHSVGFPLLAE